MPQRCVILCLVFLYQLPVTAVPKRSYTVEDFSDLINSRLQKLESKREAQQRYGGLLAVLREQVDSYRHRKGAGK